MGHLDCPARRGIPICRTASGTRVHGRCGGGTEVAALCYTLCETATLVGVDPRAYLLRALYAAMAYPGAVTYCEDLTLTSTA